MNISMLFASMMNDCINGTIEVVVRCHQLNNNIFLRLIIDNLVIVMVLLDYFVIYTWR